MKKVVVLIIVFIAVVVMQVVCSELKLSGFAQTQLMGDKSLTGKETSFTVKRVRIIAKNDINDKISIFAQLETFTANNNVLDFVIDYNVGPAGKISFGRFTIPVGLQNPVSPYNLNTINYAQVVQKLVGSGGRDYGIKLTGKKEKFNWVVAVINGADGGTTTVSTTDDNNVKDIVGRLGISLMNGFDVGVSFYDGEYNVVATDSSTKTTKNIYALDAKYEKNNVYAQAEYLWGKNGTTKKRGYYLETGYILNKLQPIVKYESYDGDTSIADSSEVNIFAGGFNYYLDSSSKVQFIYESKSDKFGNNLTDKSNNTWILQTAVKF